MLFFKVITNFKFYKHCFIREDLWKHICIIRWCAKEIHWLGPTDLKIYYKKPATVIQKLTESIDFRQNYICDFHLSTKGAA